MLYYACMGPCRPTYQLRHKHRQLPQEIQTMLSVARNEHRMEEDDLSDYHEVQRLMVKRKQPVAVLWKHINSHLETGDLLLMVGSSGPSRAIRLMTGRWSHVCMVVVRLVKDRDGNDAKQILLWECVSHADDCKDVITGQYKSGVRLVDMAHRLSSCDSPYFGVVKLGRRSDMRVDPEEWYRMTQKRFRAFSKQEINKPYEPQPVNMLRVVIDCGGGGGGGGHSPGDVQVDKSSYFCSKLVCETLRDMGIVARYYDPAKTCPTDFWDYDLPLQGGVQVQALFFMPRLDVAGDEDVLPLEAPEPEPEPPPPARQKPQRKRAPPADFPEERRLLPPKNNSNNKGRSKHA